MEKYLIFMPRHDDDDHDNTTMLKYISYFFQVPFPQHIFLDAIKKLKI